MPSSKFTHLLKPDAELMQEFLDSLDKPYSYINYDVHVGNGRDPGEDFDPEIRKMAIQLSQRRIDAVAHTLERIDIIEVTLNAGLTALGQLMVYPALYHIAFRPPVPLRPVVVTRKFDTDIEAIYHEQGITVFIFPE